MAAHCDDWLYHASVHHRHLNIQVLVQVNEVEGLLAAAERKADALQSDKERLLSMVSRLELDKHRLESGRAPSTTSQQPAIAGSFVQTTGCGIALCT